MKILAIIVTYNATKWVDKCLESLINSSLAPQILVIDNLSNDGTMQYIKRHYPDIETIETGTNLGFGKANNIGLRKVLEENYDFAFLLNQDAWIENNTIEVLAERYSHNKNFEILCPLQLNGKGNKLDCLFYKYTLSECTDFIFNAATSTLNQRELYEVSFANAACWLVSKRVIETIGGFDPLFPHYGEDEDYVRRLRTNGYKIGICPNVRVFHDREYREDEFSFNKGVNNSFVRVLNLIKRKDPKKGSTSLVKELLKRVYIQTIKMMFFKDKLYYLSDIISIFKAASKYRTAVNHRKMESNKGAHYITKIH